MKISAVLLAAGLSRRMGRDKLLLEYNGTSFLQRAVDLLAGLPVYERIVVTVDNKQDNVTYLPGMKVKINKNPENGLSGSVRIGVEAATGSHYIFLNGDQPKLTLHDLLPLLGAAEENPEKIIFPVIDSKPVTPTLFPGNFRNELLNLKGDTGGREVRDKHKENCFTITPENPENFKDIDTEEDIRKEDFDHDK